MTVMRREPRFRGKRKDGGWEYGFLTWNKRHGYVIQSHDQYGMTFFASVVPETVGQFTGLRDKNGQEIYEGDILRLYGATDYRVHIMSHPVVFENGCFCIKTKHSCLSLDIVLPACAIGNIHENPELLEVW